MKRFYCTVCKKMKRVQKWPVNIEFDRFNIPDAPEDRIGECNRHSSSSSFRPNVIRENKVGR